MELWNCVLRKYCNAVLLYFFGFGTLFLGLVHLDKIALMFPSVCWMPHSGSDALGLMTSLLEYGKEVFNLFHVADLQMSCISLFSLHNMGIVLSLIPVPHIICIYGHL